LIANGAHDVLATVGGLDAVVALQFGAGLVVAAADGNFLDDGTRNPAGVQFSQNVFGYQAVPVPAAAWLFGSGLISLVGMARRKKAA